MSYYVVADSKRGEDIGETLSHGSGINSEWIITDKGSYLKCVNSYHAMNEDGYYVGHASFSVIIPIKDPLSFRLNFHGSFAQYLNKFYGLRDYLEDVIHYCLSEHFKSE